MKTILAAVDFSNVSDSVVTQAAALARAVKARVLVVTVVQRPVIYPMGAANFVPATDKIDEIAEAAKKDAARRLTEIRKHLHTDRITSESIQLMGAPVKHILAQAKRHAADYIVMGSHGHTALYELLVGSTTHGVLLRARCPVVIVPAKKKLGGTKR